MFHIDFLKDEFMARRISISPPVHLINSEDNDIYQVDESEKNELVELISSFCKPNEYLEAQTLYRSLASDLQQLDEVSKERNIQTISSNS